MRGKCIGSDSWGYYRHISTALASQALLRFRILCQPLQHVVLGPAERAIVRNAADFGNCREWSVCERPTDICE